MALGKMNPRHTVCPRKHPLFQTMNYVGANKLSLQKYRRFKPSFWKDIGIRKFKILAKTQFLLELLITKY